MLKSENNVFRLSHRVSEKYRIPYTLLSKENEGERNFPDGLRCGISQFEV